jgi:hypothetical protein
MKLIKIYCGRSKPDGSLIHMTSINEFIQAEVATQYEGFTIIHSEGYWNGKREFSFIIETVVEPGVLSHHVDFRPTQIANAYKKKYSQEDVLVTIQDVVVLPI